MAAQTASSKGQVTIPVAIRRKLGIEAGTPIRFVERDGLVVLEKVDSSLRSLCGIVKARVPIQLDEVDERIAQSVADKLANASR